jgi:two-component system, NtrC family, sensor histidine kinase HydH
MKHNLKVIEPKTTKLSYLSPYQEIAMYVRDLLRCDYAIVAVPEKDAIRICAVAGAEPEGSANIADLVLRLRDWGPMVVDDSRLISAPIICSDHVLGVLVGYSAEPGTFTSEDLDRLMNYSPVALGILANAAAEERGSTRTSFSHDELLHFSRLITIGELSACFAHEVTNPLMLIRGHVRFVEESLPLDHPLRMNFEVIERASHRLEEMAKRMLDFSRKRTRRTEPCEIAELISDGLRFVQPYLRSQYIDVQVQLDPLLPMIDLDRWQMVQAVVNLLQNAADSMADADKRVLSITTRVEGGAIRLAISDTGTGIASANVQRIFEPFFTTKGDRGTGLGLFITKQVIEEHRGSISVETSSRGTTFVISLPL